MKNYGRGWSDGYGSQSVEAMNAEYERSERDHAQNVRSSEARASSLTESQKLHAIREAAGAIHRLGITAEQRAWLLAKLAK